MTDYVTHGGIQVAKEIDDLVRDEIAPGTGVDRAKVWSLLDGIVRELGRLDVAEQSHAPEEGLRVGRRGHGAD